MSVCSRCGAAFDCGMADQTGQPCWCTQLPRLPRSAIDPDGVSGAAACLCPSCLKERIRQAGQKAHARD